MPSFRERARDTLLRVGTENALDRATVLRGLDSVHPAAPGRGAAMGAMALAARADAAVLWLSWRLRPRRMTL